MPCNSDHMKPTPRELNCSSMANSLVYALGALERDVPEWISDVQQNWYNNSSDELQDKLAQALCALCTEIEANQEGLADRIIYNGRNTDARTLAGWWEKHQAADKAQREDEAAVQQRKETAREALSKLTDEEIKALGLKPQSV